MCDINSLDSIIYKYRDKLNISQSKTQINNVPSYTLLKPKISQGIVTHNYSFNKNDIIDERSRRRDSEYNEREERINSSRNKSPEKQQTSTNVVINKYKQTLSLYYDEVSKNKKLNEQLQLMNKKLMHSEKMRADLQHVRLTEKLEYVNKLQILNQNQRQSNPTIISHDLISKIDMLEDQAWQLRKNQEDLIRKVRLLEQQNIKLHNTKRDELAQSPKRKTENNDLIDNPPLSNQMSFYNQTPPNQNNQDELLELKQNIQKLQRQNSDIVLENQRLRNHNEQLNDQLDQYRQRISQLEDSLYQQESKPLSRTLKKKNKYNNTRQDISSSSNDSESSGKEKQQGKEDIQRKLKNLERDYERICSQMLTVESAKKIAKQTSKYYNNKK